MQDGGALPVIMSIIGPRETHDYRNYNLLGSGIIKSKKNIKKSPSVVGGQIPTLNIFNVTVTSINSAGGAVLIPRPHPQPWQERCKV